MIFLRRLRIALALVVFAGLTSFFLDFSETIPPAFAWLAKIQFLPALTGALGGLTVSALILAFLFVLALVFGRVYCSCICPLGIMQDLIARFSRFFQRKKKRRFYEYVPAHKKLRIGFLIILAVSVILGCLGSTSFAFFTGILDPYADFGRIVTHIVYPVYAFGNNLLVGAARHFGSLRFYLVDLSVQSWFALGTALVSLGIAGSMAFRYGRLFCNSVCPVGTILGFCSRRSLFRVQIDREKCVGCRVCEHHCKGMCIDIENKRVENDRCVVCLNCLSLCRKDAIHYELARKSSTAEKPESDECDLEKRRFLEKSARLLAAGTLLNLAGQVPAQEGGPSSESPVPEGEPEMIGGLPVSKNGKVPYKLEHAVSPPGSVSLRHLAARCTSCHLCVAQCPSGVIKPAFLDYGFGGTLLPVMKFSTEVFCNYDCTRCGEVCPTGAIKPLTIEEKHTTQTGRVVFIKENCVVFTEETNCGACAEHCPTQAVRMVDYKGNLTIPETREEYCIGCGACESICPVIPFKAVHVEGNDPHKPAQLPPQEEKSDVQVDSFGF